MNSGATSKLSAYIADYPQGADRAQALYYLADAAWNEGKPAEAQGYAMQVIQTHPDSEVAEDAMLIKAAAESSLGKTEIAYSTYQQLENRASGSNMLREARIGLMRTAADLGKICRSGRTPPTSFSHHSRQLAGRPQRNQIHARYGQQQPGQLRQGL